MQALGRLELNALGQRLAVLLLLLALTNSA
jgi:hypothetical protein